MKSRTLLVSILLVLGLVLVACGGTEDVATVVEEVAPVVEEAVEEVAEAVEEAVEEVVEEPTEEPVMEEMEEADLDGAFTVFLEDMEGYNTIAPDLLYGLTAAGGDSIFILDVRSPSELVEKGWIEGAVNIPLRDLADSTEYLPSEDTTIATYCGSGWRCTIALTALEAMGWDDVLGLKGGSYAGWVEAGYPISAGTPDEPVALNAYEPDPAIVAEMQEMLQAVPDSYGVITAEAFEAEIAENADLIVIDVRRAEEVEEKGYIETENTLFIPLEDFIASQEMWPADLDTPIVVYCGSGHRSTIAMSILWSYDYTDVRSLKGGFGGWASEGYPVAGAPEMGEEMMETAVLNAGFQTLLDDMEAYNTISPDVLYGMTAGGSDVFILDVRNPDELTNNGWIENAVNIPFFELADSTAYLPSFDTPIVSYCGSGWRCTIALTMLEGMGWEDVKGLKGGSYAGWVDAGFPISAGMAPEAVELNAVEIDEDVLAAAQELNASIPEGYGVITAENLLLEQEANDELILIDVRQPSELAEKGIIEHDADRWMNIPLEDFIASSDQWPADLDAPIVVYCGSGHRSTMAMTMLYANGYTNVHSLKGGFGGWAEAGNPVVAAPAELSILNDGFQVFLDEMEAYNTISPDVLYGMTAGGNDVFILDVRNPDELTNNGWIENAVNIPFIELADSTASLPSFDTPIVSYCGSGWRCTIALTMLEGMGWEDVKGLKGGSYAGWVDAGFPISAGMAPEAVELNAVELSDDVLMAGQELNASIPEGYGVITAENLVIEQEADEALVLIDVRQPSELAEKGIIEHDADRWMNIPLEDFIASADQWPADLDTPIVVYCGSGHRSTIAMTMLYANGYTNVHSLKGGFGGWAEAGNPVVDAPVVEAPVVDAPAETAVLNDGFQVFLDDMEAYNTISPDVLYGMTAGGNEVFILDVRNPDELTNNGWIENAVNIPFFELADSTAYLPSFDTPIVSYCGSGWRCTIALTALEAMGWEDVKGLKGGSYAGWVDAGFPISAGMAPEAVELNAVELSDDVLMAGQELIASVPEGYGVITAENLAAAQEENTDLILIDVRQESELVEKGVIEHDADHWMNIPLEDFIASEEMWPADLDAPIVVYCGSGHRSTIAMTMLYANGYTDVHSLKGGFGGWAEAEYPVAEYAMP